MSLTIVIPADDEEDRIDRTLTAYRRGFPQSDITFRVALDGCRDRTADVVARHVRADPRVVVQHHPKLGKGGVLMESFRRCDTDLVAFVDADCATPPSELARMTEAAADVDGVIASRRLPASVTPSHRAAGRGSPRRASPGSSGGSSTCRTPTRSVARKCCGETWSSGSCP